MWEYAIPVSIGRDTLVEPIILPPRVSEDKIVNSRGKLLLEFCSVNGLYIMNGRSGNDQNHGHYTCVNAHGASVVDYLLTDSSGFEQIVDFEIGSEHNSDHFPLLFTLCCRKTPSDESDSFELITTLPIPPVIKWDQSKCTLFREAIHSDPVYLERVKTCCDAGDIESAMTNLANVVRNAASAAGMKNKRFSIPYKMCSRNDWFDKNCLTAKTRMNKLLRSFRKRRTRSTLDLYLIQKRKYRALLSRYKKAKSNDKLNSLMKSLDDPQKFWSLINCKNKAISCEIKPNEWFEYFRKLFLQCAISESENDDTTSDLLSVTDKSRVILDRPFNENDVHAALRKLKTNKAAGLDGIPSEICKFGGIKNTLVDLFNAIAQAGYIPKEWKTAIILPIYKKGTLMTRATIEAFHYYVRWARYIVVY